MSKSALGECGRSVPKFIAIQIFVDDLLQGSNSLLAACVILLNPASKSRLPCFSASLATVCDVDFADSRIRRPAK